MGLNSHGSKFWIENKIGISWNISSAYVVDFTERATIISSSWVGLHLHHVYMYVKHFCPSTFHASILNIIILKIMIKSICTEFMYIYIRMYVSICIHMCYLCLYVCMPPLCLGIKRYIWSTDYINQQLGDGVETNHARVEFKEKGQYL